MRTVTTEKEGSRRMVKASVSVSRVPGLTSVVEVEAGGVRVDVHVLLEARVGRALHPAVGLDGERLGGARDPGVGRARQPAGLRVTSGPGVEMLQQAGRAGLGWEVFRHGGLQLSHARVALLLGGGRAGGRQRGG